MIRHPRHRASASRLLIGGALAAALGGASAAWACTPQGTIDINDGAGEPLTGPVDTQPTVTITINYPEIFAPVGTAVVVTDDTPRVLVSVPATAPRTSFVTEVRPTQVGIYYFNVYVTTDPADPLNPDSMKPGTLRNGTYIVTATPGRSSATPDPIPATPDPIPSTPDPIPSTPGPIPSTLGPIPSTPDPIPSTPNLAPATPVLPGANPVKVPAVRTPTPSQPTASAPTSFKPVAPTAQNPTSPAVSAPRSEPALVPAPDAGSPAQQLLAPSGADLWSGLNPSGGAPSLLDTDSDRSNGELPVGAVLLGFGLLALAGVGALAGRRRFALARLRS